MLQKKHALIIGVVGIILLLGFVSVSLSAEIDAAPYLRMGAGARALGMGGAFTAVADDATSIVSNPAGLSNVDSDISFTLYTVKMDLDRKYNFLGVTKNLKSAGAVGFAWTNAGVDAIPSRDNNDNPGENFNDSNHVFALSYGYGLPDVSSSGLSELRFGASLKFIKSGFSLEGAEGTTGFGGIDIGVLGHAFENTVSCGLAIENLGGKVGDGTIPMVLDLGVAFKLLKNYEAMLALDLEHEIVDLPESTTGIRLGVEYWLRNVLAIRAGGKHTGDRRSLFGGFGVRVAGLQLDYAFKPTDDTIYQLDGSSHFVSLSYAYYK
jgi:hypothetical protein